jgi:hypothetical protein
MKYSQLLIFLLENGADPSIRNKSGFTVMDLAIHKSRNNIIKVLKNRGVLNISYNIGSDIKPRFGVELEICVKLNSKCVGVDINPKENEWIKMFKIYADSYLKNSPTVDKIKDKYEYIYVTENEKYGYSYIYDLKDFTLKPQKGRIEYDRPFFTVDKTVQCGDYEEKYNNTINQDIIRDTFHIEFVGPIIDSIDDLKDLLEFIGLTRPDCFISNKSAGFHVNVSLYDNETNKSLILSKDFFNNGFYPKYKKWESEWYPKVRLERTKFASPLGNLNNKNNIYKASAATKYVALYRKNPELYEFRLFGSNNDINTLLKYTNEAITLLATSYIEWSTDMKK